MTFANLLIRRRLVAASLLAVIGLGLAWWFVWMTPQAQKLTSVRAQQAQATATRGSLLMQLRELQQDSKEARSAAAYLKRFNAAIPSTPDAPGLVVEVYRLAQRDGVQLSSITDNSLVPASGYSSIPVSIEVSGGHDQVISFVSGLYRIDRLLTIQGLSISGAQNINQSSAATTSASVSATAYTLQTVKTSAPSA